MEDCPVCGSANSVMDSCPIRDEHLSFQCPIVPEATLTVSIEGTICKWTSASTPPVKNGSYLTTVASVGFDGRQEFKVRETVYWSNDWDEGDSWQVIAWAPLPSPYEAK